MGFAGAADWDLAGLADWEPEDPEEEPPGLAMPEPEALDLEALETEALDLEALDLEASDLKASEREALETEASEPEASDLASEPERRGLGCAEAGSRKALKADPRDQTRGNGGWFAAGGVADELLPGPRLAGFIADAWAIGLGRLTDDELIGMMRAAQAAGVLVRGDGTGCRRGSVAPPLDRGAGRRYRCRPPRRRRDRCRPDVNRRAADQVLSLAVALRRLPLTSRALTAGDIDLPRAMVIADEVTGLDDEHAAAVEQVIIGKAAGQTTGQLRAATRRAVLSADPRAARKRKERALQDSRVERWDEHGGTAALAGRDLPPASVLAADQNLSALARQLKSAGAPGTTGSTASSGLSGPAYRKLRGLTDPPGPRPGLRHVPR